MVIATEIVMLQVTGCVLVRLCGLQPAQVSGVTSSIFFCVTAVWAYVAAREFGPMLRLFRLTRNAPRVVRYLTHNLDSTICKTELDQRVPAEWSAL